MATSTLVIGCALVGVVTAPGPKTATAAPVQTATTARSARAPRAPAIAQAQYTVAAFAGRPAPIKVTWPALAGVSRFRARWTDAGGRVDVDLPGTATRFERPEATAGHHQLSVVAIDERGAESEPAEAAIDVVTITAIPPGGSAAHPAPGPAFAIGSTFSSPGLPCQLASAPAARAAIATTPGATTLSCGGEPGQPHVDVPVVIAPVVIAGPTAPIVRATPTRIHVTIASVAPLGDRLQVEPIGELALGEVERSGMSIDVPVTASAGAATAGLVIRADAIELGRIDLTLVDRARLESGSESGSEPQIRWFALDLGGQVGALVMLSEGKTATALGMPTNPADTLTNAPLFGVRAGLFPTRRVGVESELSLAIPGYLGHPGFSLVASARAQLAARLVEDQRYGLRLLGGAGILGVLTRDATSRPAVHGAVHWGAAFTIETRRDLWLRIEALHVITTGQDAGFAHDVELQVGVVTRLGRRDRSW